MSTYIIFWGREKMKFGPYLAVHRIAVLKSLSWWCYEPELVTCQVISYQLNPCNISPVLQTLFLSVLRNLCSGMDLIYVVYEKFIDWVCSIFFLSILNFCWSHYHSDNSIYLLVTYFILLNYLFIFHLQHHALQNFSCAYFYCAYNIPIPPSS